MPISQMKLKSSRQLLDKRGSLAGRESWARCVPSTGSVDHPAIVGSSEAGAATHASPLRVFSILQVPYLPAPAPGRGAKLGAKYKSAVPVRT